MNPKLKNQAAACVRNRTLVVRNSYRYLFRQAYVVRYRMLVVRNLSATKAFCCFLQVLLVLPQKVPETPDM